MNNVSLIHRYMLCILPLCMLTGPFLPDLIISLSALIFIYLSISRKKYEYFKSTYFLLFISWWLIIVISSLLSINPTFSLESSFFYFRFGLFVLSVWYIFDHDDQIIKYFTYSFGLVFIFIIIDGFFQYITGYNFLGYPYQSNYSRLSGIFNEKWFLGGFLSKNLPILLALIIMYFGNSKVINSSITLLIVSTVLLTFLTGERSAFISIVIFLFLIMVLLNKWQNIRIITLLLSILMVLVITFSDTKIKERMFSSTINQINIFSENYVPDHELLFKSAIQMFKSSPLIGNGPKMFRKLCSDEKYYFEFESYNSCSTHPHQTYLQLLAETGLIGTIPIIFLFFYISWTLLYHLFQKTVSNRQIKMNDAQILLFIAIFITLWPINVNLNFFGNWISVIYFLPIGILLSLCNKNTKIKSV